MGFRSIRFARDNEDPTCINLWVEFESEQTINLWAASPLHNQLVSRLDPYRTKKYEVKRYLIERCIE